MEKTYETALGKIRYWTTKTENSKETLVFLHGLTADHRLFDRQINFFKSRFNTLVWDAPGHAASRPFELNVTLEDEARLLDEILTKEGISHPIIIGQSIGGYLGQVYAQIFPNKMKGFIAIDSGPLQRKYTPKIVTWGLRNIGKLYPICPWSVFLECTPPAVATTKVGRALMHTMLKDYAEDPTYFKKLAAHGYGMIGGAIDNDLEYKISCPTLLICGTKDLIPMRNYNASWSKKSNIKLEWVESAGHNSNTDRPGIVNVLIEEFIYRHF